MMKWVLVGLALMWAGPAAASESLGYGRPAAWVRAQTFAEAAPVTTNDAARLALPW